MGQVAPSFLSQFPFFLSPFPSVLSQHLSVLSFCASWHGRRAPCPPGARTPPSRGTSLPPATRSTSLRARRLAGCRSRSSWNNSMSSILPLWTSTQPGATTCCNCRSSTLRLLTRFLLSANATDPFGVWATSNSYGDWTTVRASGSLSLFAVLLRLRRGLPCASSSRRAVGR